MLENVYVKTVIYIFFWIVSYSISKFHGVPLRSFYVVFLAFCLVSRFFSYSCFSYLHMYICFFLTCDLCFFLYIIGADARLRVSQNITLGVSCFCTYLWPFVTTGTPPAPIFTAPPCRTKYYIRPHYLCVNRLNCARY
jgi:hypothetical protein